MTLEESSRFFKFDMLAGFASVANLSGNVWDTVLLFEEENFSQRLIEIIIVISFF